MGTIVQDAIDFSQKLGGINRSTRKEREQARLKAAEAAKPPEILLPDEDAIKRNKRRKLAARTGGRTSTILTGRLGSAAQTSAGPSQTSRPRILDRIG